MRPSKAFMPTFKQNEKANILNCKLFSKWWSTAFSSMQRFFFLRLIKAQIYEKFSVFFCTFHVYVNSLIFPWLNYSDEKSSYFFCIFGFSCTDISINSFDSFFGEMYFKLFYLSLTCELKVWLQNCRLLMMRIKFHGINFTVI